MYYATLNDTVFFNTAVDIDEYKLTMAKVTVGANQAGNFTFTVPPCNMAYGNFHKLIDYVDVYKDDELIFSGRVYSIQKKFDTQLTIVCEGLLAILNDSILRPFTHEGSFADLIGVIIENHNSQVEANKQINVGTIQVSDSEVYREYQLHATSMSRITDLASSYGGYYYLRKESNGLYFDWLTGFSTQAEQSIDFGVNELSNYQEETSADIITVLIPLGAEQFAEDGTNISNRLTIGSVNSGIDYLEADASYIAQYGRITGVNIWDDVTVPAILKSKGQAYLNSKLVPKITITADAIDLRDAGYDIESLRWGMQVQVNSAPHGLNGTWFDLITQALDILSPNSNKVTLSSVQEGYIVQQSTIAKDNMNAVETVVANYVTNEAIKKINDLSNDIGIKFTEYEALIEQTEESITQSVTEKINYVNGQIETLSGTVELTAQEYAIYFGENGKISSWFTFDENYFSIRKNGQSVYSRQDNDSYEFCDKNNNVIVILDTNGMTAPTANVSGQLKFMQGSTGQWAIRKGKYITGKGVNLDDVWVG